MVTKAEAEWLTEAAGRRMRFMGDVTRRMELAGISCDDQLYKLAVRA